jgi:hypothetical protein
MCGASVPLVVDVARMLCRAMVCGASIHPSCAHLCAHRFARLTGLLSGATGCTRMGIAPPIESACLRAPLGDAVAQCVCARFDVPLPLELLPLGLLSVRAETQNAPFQPCRCLSQVLRPQDSPGAELQCS